MIKRIPGTRLAAIIGTLVLVSAFSGLTAASASAATIEGLQNNSNVYCLKGFIGDPSVTLAPCNTVTTDGHMQWQQNPGPGGSWFTLQNEANKYCVNGYTGTAHAEVTLTPCNMTDNHMQWQIYAEVNNNGSNWFVLQDRANNDCLKGFIGNPELSMAPCNTTDTHMQWRGY